MKSKSIPMRRCNSCMESKAKDSLFRVAFYEDTLDVDMTGKAKGRGTYICKNMECINGIKKKKALQRAFKTNFQEDILDEIVEKLANELK